MLTASIFTREPISAQGAVPVPGTEQTNRHRCAGKEGYVGRAGLESVCEDIISNLSRLVAAVRYEVVKKHRSRIPTDHGPWVPHISLVFREMWDATGPWSVPILTLGLKAVPQQLGRSGL
jgi:hypothetical protein